MLLDKLERRLWENAKRRRERDRDEGEEGVRDGWGNVAVGGDGLEECMQAYVDGGVRREGQARESGVIEERDE